MGCSHSLAETSVHPGSPPPPGNFVYFTEAPQAKSAAVNLQRTKAGSVVKVAQQIDLSQKLTQIVPSPQAQEAQNCLRSGRLFQDAAFPPNDRSLKNGPGPSDLDEINFGEWKPLHEIYQKPEIFVDGTSAPDVRQGGLGSCYLLAGLAALAESPKRIQDIFITKEMNAAHYYSVKILYRGTWREVIVDDYFPMVVEKRRRMLPLAMESTKKSGS